MLVRVNDLALVQAGRSSPFDGRLLRQTGGHAAQPRGGRRGGRAEKVTARWLLAHRLFLLVGVVETVCRLLGSCGTPLRSSLVDPVVLVILSPSRPARKSPFAAGSPARSGRCFLDAPWRFLP